MNSEKGGNSTLAYLNRPVEVTTYPLATFPFPDLVREYLNVFDLSRLHELLDIPAAPVTRETDQSTWAHRRFYTNQGGSQFQLYYRRFIAQFIAPLFNYEPLVFQAVPTFRVQQPHNLAVGEFHRDSDYNHPLTEVNFWVPLTRAGHTSSVFIEEVGGFPVNPTLNPGDLLIFDGANLRHGNKINLTGKTRVSFDFRVIRKQDYQPSTDLTVNTHLSFAVGGYYDILGPR
jgi:hypothetical protein